MTLKTTIPRAEDLHCEFKRWPIHIDELAAAIVAFANTQGGRIFIGVDDRGKRVGVLDAPEILKTIDNVARNNCTPPVSLTADVLGEPKKPIVVIHVPRGTQLPHHTNRGVCYVRTSSGRRHASREELLRMFQRVESLYYDETSVARAGLSDLDEGAIDQFLLRAYGKRARDFDTPVAQLLTNLRLLAEGSPTVSGLILFGREPQAFLPYAQINAAAFPVTELSDAPLDRKDFIGRLSEMIEAAHRFVMLHLRTAHDIRGLQPERSPELPEEAIREALVNSVVHRDYTLRGPNRLLVFSDRVEIHSAGRPPNGIDAEAMRLGTHVPRNPILLSHLAKLGFVTAIGSGVPRILRLIREATGKEAQIEIRPSETVIVLPRLRVAQRRRKQKVTAGREGWSQ